MYAIRLTRKTRNARLGVEQPLVSKPKPQTLNPILPGRLPEIQALKDVIVALPGYEALSLVIQPRQQNHRAGLDRHGIRGQRRGANSEAGRCIFHTIIVVAGPCLRRFSRRLPGHMMCFKLAFQRASLASQVEAEAEESGAKAWCVAAAIEGNTWAIDPYPKNPKP